MNPEQQEAVCLYQCSHDHDTGFCRTCGRPIPPPVEAGETSDANNLLARLLQDPTFGVQK